MEKENILTALVNDGEKVKDLKINGTTQLDGAEFVSCTLIYGDYDEMDVCFIVYDDGTWFSPYDWQGFIPQNANEIEDIDWMLGVTGRKAVILDGLPRMIV